MHDVLKSRNIYPCLDLEKEITAGIIQDLHKDLRISITDPIRAGLPLLHPQCRQTCQGIDIQICHRNLVKWSNQEREIQIYQDRIKEIDPVQGKDIQISRQKLMKDTRGKSYMNLS